MENLNVQTLAERANLAPITIHHILDSEYQFFPSVITLLKLSEVLDISVVEFFYLEEDNYLA